MLTLLYVWFGAVVGFAIGFATRWWMSYNFSNHNTSGTIVIEQNKETEKTVYSLVLDEHPETLQNKKMVVFKIENAK